MAPARCRIPLRGSSRKAYTARRRSSTQTCFAWTDAGWTGTSLEHLIIYELHVGTFTPEGTFEGAAAELDDVARARA